MYNIVLGRAVLLLVGVLVFVKKRSEE